MSTLSLPTFLLLIYLGHGDTAAVNRPESEPIKCDFSLPQCEIALANNDPRFAEQCWIYPHNAESPPRYETRTCESVCRDSDDLMCTINCKAFEYQGVFCDSIITSPSVMTPSIPALTPSPATTPMPPDGTTGSHVPPKSSVHTPPDDGADDSCLEKPWKVSSIVAWITCAIFATIAVVMFVKWKREVSKRKSSEPRGTPLMNRDQRATGNEDPVVVENRSVLHRLCRC